MSVAEATHAQADHHADETAGGEQIAYLIALALVGVLAGMTALFGLPGLSMTALALVPVIYALLILISVGK